MGNTDCRLLTVRTKNTEITTTEKNIIHAWRRYQKQTGVLPSQRWLASELEMQPFAVRWALKRLEEKGYLREQKYQATRLVLTPKARRLP